MMSDEPFKKAAKQLERATLDRRRAELSADLEAGDDPLFYVPLFERKPLLEHKVVIDAPIVPPDEAIDVDLEDVIPTLPMQAPILDDRYAAARQGQRGRSGWMGVACGIAAVLGGAAFMWTQRGSDRIAAADCASPDDLGAAKQTALAAPTVPANPDATKTPCETLLRSGGSLAVQRPEQLPPDRPSGSNRSRPSSPPIGPSKATGNDPVDPMFTEKPGF